MKAFEFIEISAGFNPISGAKPIIGILNTKMLIQQGNYVYVNTIGYVWVQKQTVAPTQLV